MYCLIACPLFSMCMFSVQTLIAYKWFHTFAVYKFLFTSQYWRLIQAVCTWMCHAPDNKQKTKLIKEPSIWGVGTFSYTAKNVQKSKCTKEKRYILCKLNNWNKGQVYALAITWLARFSFLFERDMPSIQNLTNITLHPLIYICLHTCGNSI